MALEYNILPYLKKIYPIVDSSSISNKFEYVLKNEKFTFREDDSKYEKEFYIYSAAFTLGADALS